MTQHAHTALAGTHAATPARVAPSGVLAALLATDDSRTTALLRITLGVVILPHGLQKAFGWVGGPGFDGTMGFLTDYIGLPWVLALLVVASDLLGSLALIVGLFGRVAAFGAASVMLGAVATLHYQFGFMMNWDGTKAGEGYQFHLLALALAVAVMIRGSGAASIDRLLTAHE